MNIDKEDKELLKSIKQLVEKITKSGSLPKTLEGLTELYAVWNKTYKRNEVLNNCPSCRLAKFTQLKRTYDLYDLKNQFKRKRKTDS